MTFLPAAFPGLHQRPPLIFPCICFKNDCFRASSGNTASPGLTTLPAGDRAWAWQRPGSRTQVLGPGAWDRPARVGGRSPRPGELRGRPVSTLRTFKKTPHHVHLEGWASPASPGPHRATLRCRKASQAWGQLPSWVLILSRPRQSQAQSSSQASARAPLSQKGLSGLLGAQTRHAARPTCQSLPRIATNMGLATLATTQITPQFSSWRTLTKVETRDHPVARTRTQRPPDLSLHPPSAHGLRLATYLHSLCLDLIAS